MAASVGVLWRLTANRYALAGKSGPDPPQNPQMITSPSHITAELSYHTPSHLEPTPPTAMSVRLVRHKRSPRISLAPLHPQHPRETAPPAAVEGVNQCPCPNHSHTPQQQVTQQQYQMYYPNVFVQSGRMPNGYPVNAWPMMVPGGAGWLGRMATARGCRCRCPCNLLCLAGNSIRSSTIRCLLGVAAKASLDCLADETFVVACISSVRAMFILDCNFFYV
ncbi:hypothetical protein B0H13DRAFT_2656123 [Mycena leptocephala]|nr:hypothetical protein B0H13DRAFT_2656123 [Mycena leptocephala]